MSNFIEKVKSGGDDEIKNVEEDNVSEKYLTLDPIDDSKQARNTTLIVHNITPGGAEYAIPNKPKPDEDVDNGYIDLDEDNGYMNLNETESLGGDSRVAAPLETSDTVVSKVPAKDDDDTADASEHSKVIVENEDLLELDDNSETSETVSSPDPANEDNSADASEHTKATDPYDKSLKLYASKGSGVPSKISKHHFGYHKF